MEAVVFEGLSDLSFQHISDNERRIFVLRSRASGREDEVRANSDVAVDEHVNDVSRNARSQRGAVVGKAYGDDLKAPSRPLAGVTFHRPHRVCVHGQLWPTLY